MVVAMATAGLAEPEKPEVEVVPPGVVEKDLGLYVFPPEKDPMLKKLMGEMLKEAEQDRKEMEAPVELPKLDAPELQQMIREMNLRARGPAKRWMLGVRVDPGDGKKITVNDVMPDTPAAKAGLKAGDTLVDVNRIRLRDYEMLVDLLQVVRDQEIELGVRRGEGDLRIKIKPAQRKVLVVRAPEPVAPKVVPRAELRRVKPMGGPRDDEVLQEMRRMRGLMEQMLEEMRKPKAMSAAPRSRVRRVPNPPQN